MREIHSIICNLQDNFHQSDRQIVLILAQGIAKMLELNKLFQDDDCTNILQDIDNYLDEELWGESDD